MIPSSVDPTSLLDCPRHNQRVARGLYFWGGTCIRGATRNDGTDDAQSPAAIGVNLTKWLKAG